MLPVLFGGTCDWKWKGGPTITVKCRKQGDGKRDPSFLLNFFTFYFQFLNLVPALYRRIMHIEGKLDVQAASECGWEGLGYEGWQSRGEGCGWKGEVGWGFAVTFTLAPQLMLRCCHFHHLKCCHFRCRSLAFAMGSRGVEGRSKGKREEVWEDFHFKQAQLCHTVTWLPRQPLCMFPNFLCPLCSFSCPLLLSCLPSSFSRTL